MLPWTLMLNCKVNIWWQSLQILKREEDDLLTAWSANDIDRFTAFPLSWKSLQTNQRTLVRAWHSLDDHQYYQKMRPRLPERFLSEHHFKWRKHPIPRFSRTVIPGNYGFGSCHSENQGYCSRRSHVFDLGGRFYPELPFNFPIDVDIKSWILWNRASHNP